MITIEKISKTDARLYGVYLSNGESIQIMENILIRYGLHKGKSLSTEQIAELLQESSFEYAYQQAIAYLSWQLRSEKELRTYLKQKDYSNEAIQNTCQRLRELNLLNDRLYAESYVRTMVRTSDKGPQVIARQLQQKGLTNEHIQHALELYTEEDQLQTVEKLAEKLLNRHRNRSYQEKQQKLRQGLLQKGFSGNVIDQVVQALQLTKDQTQEQKLLNIQGDKLWKRYANLEASKREQKITRALFQKGFDYDLVLNFIQQKKEEEE